MQAKISKQCRDADRPGKQPPVDFAALIEGYELMTPALRLRAKTRYMLQQVTTRAEHSDEQWTRFKFDPTQDDDHSAPFSAHDLQGHDPVAGKADVSHEAAMFGLPDSRSTPKRQTTAKTTATAYSESDSDDPPQIVPLDEAEANIADTNANVEDAVRKPTWRDKLALKKAHQAEQNRIL